MGDGSLGIGKTNQRIKQWRFKSFVRIAVAHYARPERSCSTSRASVLYSWIKSCWWSEASGSENALRSTRAISLDRLSELQVVISSFWLEQCRSNPGPFDRIQVHSTDPGRILVESLFSLARFRLLKLWMPSGLCEDLGEDLECLGRLWYACLIFDQSI